MNCILFQIMKLKAEKDCLWVLWLLLNFNYFLILLISIDPLYSICIRFIVPVCLISPMWLTFTPPKIPYCPCVHCYPLCLMSQYCWWQSVGKVWAKFGQSLGKVWAKDTGSNSSENLINKNKSIQSNIHIFQLFCRNRQRANITMDNKKILMIWGKCNLI